MKVYLALILSSFFCFVNIGFSQESTEKEVDLSFINNNKLKYSIVIMSCTNCAPIRNIGYRVVVELDEKEQKILKGIKIDTWKSLLQNDSTDWAANLILYSIYNKDAVALSMNDSIDLWKKDLKKDDLAFWRKQLKKKVN